MTSPFHFNAFVTPFDHGSWRHKRMPPLPQPTFLGTLNAMLLFILNVKMSVFLPFKKRNGFWNRKMLMFLNVVVVVVRCRCVVFLFFFFCSLLRLNQFYSNLNSTKLLRAGMNAKKDFVNTTRNNSIFYQKVIFGMTFCTKEFFSSLSTHLWLRRRRKSGNNLGQCKLVKYLSIFVTDSVTILGDLLDFEQLVKAFGNN